MSQASGTTVIVVGPHVDALGGMASVVAQMLRLDFGGRFPLRHFPFTESPEGVEERGVTRAARHLRHVCELRRMIRHSDRPIVHLHTCSGHTFLRTAIDLAAIRSLRCGTVLHIHGAKFDAFHDALPWFRRRMVRRCLEAADRVIALSAGWGEKLLSMAPGARVRVIENAVASPLTKSAASRRGPCRFVALSRMDEWKGIDDLLSACVMLKERGAAFRLTLAGPGGTAGDAAGIAGKILQLGLESCVVYVGPVRSHAKDELFAQADVFVLPSRHEGMPIVLLEALSRGLPVVATRVGAVPEVITDGREGLLVAPRQAEQLAGAMRRVIDNANERASMGAAAGRLADRRFSLDRLRGDLETLYVEVAGEDVRPWTRGIPSHREGRRAIQGAAALRA